MSGEERRVRRHPRLKGYDYGTAGSYFVTVCVHGRRQILSRITQVGRDALIPPQLALTGVGKIVENAILATNSSYPDVTVDHYVIMPDHIHMIITIRPGENGGMRASRPTLPLIVRAIKNRVTREWGKTVWQDSFYETVIRDEIAYQEIWQYIDANPARWLARRPDAGL